jgi:hypothetical protein
MSIEVRYRTHDGDTVGEEVLHLTRGDDVDHLMRVLTTAAPFGATLRTTDDDGAVASELVVGIQDTRGALHYSDDTGSWYTHGPTPDNDGPVYAEVDFPEHTEIPAADIRAALTEYVHTQARPTSVTWQQDPYAG